MKKYFIIALLLTFAVLHVSSQSKISFPNYLHIDFNDSIKNKIFNSVDILFTGIDNEKVDSQLVCKENFEINIKYLRNLKWREYKDTINHFYKTQIINLYRVSANEFIITFAMAAIVKEEPVIGEIFNVLANTSGDKITFANPIIYYTRGWNHTVIGDITYIYRDTLNVKRAEDFNQKNKLMASKLGLLVLKFNMYMCKNYPEVMHIQGIEYDVSESGISNSGYIFDPNNLFSIWNNEDFSHDVFHIYSSKIRKQKRNNCAEEGLAYSWGNAYYSDLNGNIPSQKELMVGLKNYLKENPNENLLNIFDKRPKIYKYSCDYISVKWVIAGIICDEVERQSGIDGIKQLIDCGKGDDNFFKAIDKLIHINRNNFNEKVKLLLDKEIH